MVFEGWFFPVVKQFILYLMEAAAAVPLTQSPFAVLTFIVAPALLTNATSMLAQSTINRLLRTRERMAQFLAKSEKGVESDEAGELLLQQVDRAEAQAALLMRALFSIYLALAAFAGATFITLLGVVLASLQQGYWLKGLVLVGLGLGFVGFGGLIWGSACLFRATAISLLNIHQEAEIIRGRGRARGR